MEDVQVDSFFDELEKISSSPSVARSVLKGVGAGALLGGGVAATRAVGKEMDLRTREVGKYSPEQISKARKDRKKYHAGSMVAGSVAAGIGGGAIAHYGPRALSHVGTSMKEGVETGFTAAGDKVADRFRDEWGPEAKRAVQKEVRSVKRDATRPLRRVRVAGKKAWRVLNTPIGKLIKKSVK